MPKRRLYQVLRDAGIGDTISQTRTIILQKRVSIDGTMCTLPGFQVETGRIVKVDGQEIKAQDKVYFILNKPKGYSCQKNEKTPFVGGLIPDTRVSPVGRLDFDTTGLLIMTNDGELAAKITSPESTITKTYLATLNKKINLADVDQIRAGVNIEVEGAMYKTKPCTTIAREGTIFEITITEGKKRQVRLMFQALGYAVVELMRIKIGKLQLGELKIGKYRGVSKEEILSNLYK